MSDVITHPLFGAKGSTGGGGNFRQTPDNLRSKDTFEGLMGIAVGPLKGPVNGLKSVKLDGTPIENETGELNFPGFVAFSSTGNPANHPEKPELRLGSAGAPLPVNAGLVNPPDGSSIFITRTLNNVAPDYIDLRFIVQQLYRQDKNGIFDETMSILVEVKPTGSGTWINPMMSATPTNGGNPLSGKDAALFGAILYNQETAAKQNAYAANYTITGKTTAPAVFELRLWVPSTGAYANTTWDVRARLIEKQSENIGEDVVIQRQVSLESLAAVYTDEIGEEEEWRGVAWFQFYGVASDQLSGVPEVEIEMDAKIVSVPNIYNGEARTYSPGLWDGSWSKSWTNDPAWVINDAISDELSGLALVAEGAHLNKWDALEASKWFSELVSDGKGGTHPRYSLNVVANSPMNAEEFIRYLAGAVGAFAWDEGNGEWRMRVDKPDEPVDIFTLDTIEGEFIYSHSDVDTRFNDYTGTFLNAEMDYREDSVHLYDNESIAKIGHKPTSVALVGCTNRQEAMRRLMIRMRSSVNETRLATFVTNRRGRNIEQLNTILIADGHLGDQASRTQGRTIAVSQDRMSVVIRDPMRLELGIDYTLKFSHPNPAYNPLPTAMPDNALWKKPTLVVSRNIVNDASQRGAVTTLYLDSPLPTGTADNLAVALEAVGLPTIPKLYRVTNVIYDDDGERVSISALEVDAGKWYAADNVSNINTVFQNLRGAVPQPLLPPGGDLISIVVSEAEQGQNVALSVNWTRPSGTNVAGFQVTYTINGGTEQTLVDKTTLTSADLVNPVNGDYEFFVYTLNRKGTRSIPLSGKQTVNPYTISTEQIRYTDGQTLESLKPAGPGATRNFPRGPWATGVDYFVGDIVSFEGSSYIVTVAHTSTGAEPDFNKMTILAEGGGGTAGPGLNGYVHIAYADSLDGTKNFTTGGPNGRMFRGEYADNTAADSTNPALYKWSQYVGPPSFGLALHGVVDSAAIRSNTFEKTTGSSSWDVGAYSTEGFRGGVQTGFKAKVGGIMAGLNSDPTNTASFDSIDYGWLLNTNGQCEVWLDGAFLVTGGTWDVNTVFQVHYDNTKIRWLKNGAVFHTHDVPVNLLLYFDSSISTVGAGVNSLSFTSAGAKGQDGEALGVPGEDGADGQTSYVHIAYADSADGTQNFTTGAPNGRGYRGEYVDFNPSDSESPTAYTWNQYVGPPSFGLALHGNVTEGFLRGNMIQRTSGTGYTFGAYSTEGYRGGSAVSFRVSGGDVFAGLNTDAASSGNGNSIDYAFQAFAGGTISIKLNGINQNVVGLGTWTNSTVFQVVYNNESVQFLIDGVLKHTVAATPNQLLFFDSSVSLAGANINSIGWSSAGTKGADGEDGIDGQPGQDGEDGLTTYFHTAFADSIDGTVNFTTGFPNGRQYFGQYTDFIATDSTNPASYAWSLYTGPATFGLVAMTTAGQSNQGFVRSNEVHKFDAANGGTSSFNFSGYSTEGYRGGAQVTFKVKKALSGTTTVYAGLNVDPTLNALQTGIDYAWAVANSGSNSYVSINGTISGVDGGAWTETTVFQVLYDNETVKWIKDGTVVHSVTVAANLLFYFDSSITTPGAAIVNIGYSPAGAAGSDGNYRDTKFIRSASQPATPTVANPAGWSEGIPDGNEAVWQIVSTKKADGTLLGSWSAPKKVTGLNNRGAWSAATTYYLNDVVTKDGSSFIALVNGMSGSSTAPSSSGQPNSYWDVLAGKGEPGAPGTPVSGFTATINVPSTDGTVNLRALADALPGGGYTGQSNATVTYNVPAGVVVRGLPGLPNGSAAIDTGLWPSGYTIALTLNIAGTVDGGGGQGGGGGTNGTFGGNGGAGGDAILLRTNVTGGINISAGAVVRGGGGGGGGGASYVKNIGTEIEPDLGYYGGGGGGGGFPNGSGGGAGSGSLAPQPNAGSAGTTSGGGSGGSSVNGFGGAGQAGGAAGANGIAGSNAGGYTGTTQGGTGGNAGAAVRKNGNTATVTNNGTLTGFVG